MAWAPFNFITGGDVPMCEAFRLQQYAASDRFLVEIQYLEYADLSTFSSEAHRERVAQCRQQFENSRLVSSL
jgi:hypothetical protein